MQTNMAMNADYEGDLGTHEADGYGGELEFDAGSNDNSSNYSPRMINGVETTELQRLIPNSPNAQANNYV